MKIKPKVKVTLGHIALGEPKNATQCPIAISLRDQGFDWVVVTSFCVTMHDPKTGETLSFWPPLSAQLFVADFDSGKPVSPIEFVLEEPSPYTLSA